MSYSTLLSRSYDLRGIYGTDIDDDMYYRLGYAYARVTGAARIALGYDARTSSVSLQTAFAAGAIYAGATIVDIGLVSSDMLSYATCAYPDIDAGVMITASHNPKEYNGMKSLAHTGEPYNLKKYGAEMWKIMDEMSPPSTSTYVDIDEGKKEYRDVSDAWIEHILDFAGRDIDWSTYTIVADGGSGCAGAFMGKLALRAGFTYIPLYMAPDGDFPYHHPNPMLAENRADARDMLLQKNADIAFIFDGDADRVVVLDDHGDMVTSGVLSSIIAQGLSTRYPQASYIGNATISHVFADTVHTLGSIYEREMVGHVYIREHMMRDPSIVYAGEHSAHYFFRDNYYMDSGIVAGMVFLAAVARSSQKVSTMTSTYSREYITLEEKNFTVADSKACIQKLLSIYQKEDHDMLDGLTVRYTDGSWYNVRASSNEPLLRLNLEAKTQSRYDELYAEVMGYIG